MHIVCICPSLRNVLSTVHTLSMDDTVHMYQCLTYMYDSSVCVGRVICESTVYQPVLNVHVWQQCSVHSINHDVHDHLMDAWSLHCVILLDTTYERVSVFKVNVCSAFNQPWLHDAWSFLLQQPCLVASCWPLNMHIPWLLTGGVDWD